jgi:hypothetical protein
MGAKASMLLGFLLFASAEILMLVVCKKRKDGRRTERTAEVVQTLIAVPVHKYHTTLLHESMLFTKYWIAG